MSALTSLTASSIAILATFPIVEWKVKIAPMFTTEGLEEETFAAAAAAAADTPKNTTQQITQHKFISISNEIALKF